MGTRKNISDQPLKDVFIASRRRCCICFGLKRDEEPTRGQIAHLDRNPSNNDSDNLAFLCLEHHDEYDGRTSQSKGFTKTEVKAYRKELYAHFGSWATTQSQVHLLNFLASTIGLEEMADAATKICHQVVYYGARHAYDVLTMPEMVSCDGMLYTPHLLALDYFQSWGWLTYEYEETEIQPDLPEVHIKVKHEPICKEVAKVISERLKKEQKGQP